MDSLFWTRNKIWKQNMTNCQKYYKKKKVIFAFSFHVKVQPYKYRCRKEKNGTGRYYRDIILKIPKKYRRKKALCQEMSMFVEIAQ